MAKCEICGEPMPDGEPFRYHGYSGPCPKPTATAPAPADAKARDIGKLVAALDDTGSWWMIGKGIAGPQEPMFGCVIQEPKLEGRILAKVEGNSLDYCIIEALERITK